MSCGNGTTVRKRKVVSKAAGVSVCRIEQQTANRKLRQKVENLALKQWKRLLLAIVCLCLLNAFDIRSARKTHATKKDVQLTANGKIGALGQSAVAVSESPSEERARHTCCICIVDSIACICSIILAPNWTLPMATTWFSGSDLTWQPFKMPQGESPIVPAGLETLGDEHSEPHKAVSLVSYVSWKTSRQEENIPAVVNRKIRLSLKTSRREGEATCYYLMKREWTFPPQQMLLFYCTSLKTLRREEATRFSFILFYSAG